MPIVFIFKRFQWIFATELSVRFGNPIQYCWIWIAWNSMGDFSCIQVATNDRRLTESRAEAGPLDALVNLSKLLQPWCSVFYFAISFCCYVVLCRFCCVMVLMSCWRKDALLSSCPMSDYTAIAATAAADAVGADAYTVWSFWNVQVYFKRC